MSIRLAGERGLLVEVQDNATAHQLAAWLRAEHGSVLVDVVPGHETVLVVGRDRRVPVELIAAWKPSGRGGLTEVETEIPVRYDGPDIADVARECGMSPEEVVRRHGTATYTVGFIGFAPGFAYLLGGDPNLRPSRLAQPRSRVDQGSVAIAGEYSAVYPRSSPGGWRLIGSTDARMFDPDREQAVLLNAGDTVKFVALARV